MARQHDPEFFRSRRLSPKVVNHRKRSRCGSRGPTSDLVVRQPSTVSGSSVRRRATQFGTANCARLRSRIPIRIRERASRCARCQLPSQPTGGVTGSFDLSGALSGSECRTDRLDARRAFAPQWSAKLSVLCRFRRIVRIAANHHIDLPCILLSELARVAAMMETASAISDSAEYACTRRHEAISGCLLA
jgi:hypothetical protein